VGRLRRMFDLIPDELGLSPEQRRMVRRRARRLQIESILKQVLIYLALTICIVVALVVIVVLVRPLPNIWVMLGAALAVYWTLLAIIMRWQYHRRINVALAELGYPVCPHCGYLTRGVEDRARCPECGGQVGQRWRQRSKPIPWDDSTAAELSRLGYGICADCGAVRSREFDACPTCGSEGVRSVADERPGDGGSTES
jgi:RNA polymerase subunit RPABC4/transcription elongation factor Spt4